MRVALLHPYLKTKGGAERLVHEYAVNSSYDVDVYTITYIPERTFDFSGVDVYELSSIPWLRNIAETFFLRGFAFTALSAFSKVDLSDYDAVLVSVSGIGEFFTVRNKIPGATFAYVHSPLRAAGTYEDLLWMKKHLSFSRRLVHGPARWGYNFLQRFVWPNFDHAFFNSHKTMCRGLRLGLVNDFNASVLYPGVSFPRRMPVLGSDFIYVSRIAPMKRQLELIRAWVRSEFAKHGYVLHIVGHPSKKVYADRVEAVASRYPDVVRVHYDVSDGEIEDLYREAGTAFFLGYHEDFGISPVEALARGRFLITVDSAGFLEPLPAEVMGIARVRESVCSAEFVDNISSVLDSVWYVYREFPEDFEMGARENADLVRMYFYGWDVFSALLDNRIEERVVR